MDIDWSNVTKLQPPLTMESDKQDFLQLIEVYIDDFIGVIQSTNKSNLRQFSRRVLDGITKVFPLPELSSSKMAHPVSEKKLIEDGIWDTRKKILGWLFDGMAQTIELPQRKCKELLLQLKAARRLRKLEIKPFQKLHSRLQFATIAIPCGKPILGQLNWYMSSAAKNKGHNLIVMEDLQAILRDWSALIRLVGKLPTNPRCRTHQTTTILSRVRGCVKMGSRRRIVQRHKTAHPHRVVLRVAPGHKRPIMFLF
jgi:hypothetical protein